MDAKKYDLKKPIRKGRKYEVILNFPLEFKNQIIEMYLENPNKTTIKFDSVITETATNIHYVFTLQKAQTAILIPTSMKYEIAINKEETIVEGTVKIETAMDI